MIRNLLRTIKQFTSKGAIEGYFAVKYAEFARGTEEMRQEYRRLAEKVATCRQEGRLLEIGPGPGYIAIELSKLGNFQITGLDISEAMIEIAKRNAKEADAEIKFRLGDAANMPFENNSFDFIISSGSLHHWKEPIKIFDEIHRTLKTKGKALVCDVRRDASKEELNRIAEKIDSFIMKWGLKHSIKEAYTKYEIIELVAETKFKKCEITETTIDLEIWLEKL